MPRRPLIPIELRSRPFDADEAFRHGLTKYHLDGPTWKRLGRRIYARSDVADIPMVRLAAAMRRLPDGAVFSGRTAGWLHGLDLEPCNPIEVTVPIASGVSRRAGVSVHRCKDLERSIAKGLPVTPQVRTAVDLVRNQPLVEAVAILDVVLHRGIVTKTELLRWVSARLGYRGVATLRHAIDFAEPATESPMETRLRMLLVLSGLPKPKVQVTLRDDFGIFLARPDLYFPGHRLAIEYDGATHRHRLSADNRRQNRLIDAGYRVIRFTAADVFQNPVGVVRLVRRAIAKPVG